MFEGTRKDLKETKVTQPSYILHFSNHEQGLWAKVLSRNLVAGTFFGGKFSALGGPMALKF